MPLSPVPRPPDPARVAVILGRRGGSDTSVSPERADAAERAGAAGWADVAERAGAAGWADLAERADGAGRGGVAQPGDAATLETRLRRSRRPGIVTVPEQVRLGRVAVSTSAVVALVALVVALACAFLLRVLWAEREAAGEPAGVHPTAARTGVAVTRTAPGEGSASEGGPTGAKEGVIPAGGPTATTGGGSSQVVVHVVGQVKRPGLVRLAAGARVADAVSAAGGPSKHADLAALNLARPVTDGEQVYVPRPGETPRPPAAAPGAGGSGGSGSGSGSGAGPGPGSGPVNLNTADLAALDSLPGVGPVLAQRILDWRAEHGRFSSVEELSEVSGIGDKLLAQLKPKVTL